MHPSQPSTSKSPVRDEDSIAAVSSIAYGFMGSQALFAALDLGIFTALAVGPLDAGELARKLCAQLEPLHSLLAACYALELIEREEIPLAYLPGNATRIRVKAVGDLTLR